MRGKRWVIWSVILLTCGLLRAERVDPPQAAVVPLRAGGGLRGKILTFDESGFKFQPTKGLAGEYKWADVQPRAVLALNERLLGENGTARQWLGVGRTLHSMRGGSTFAAEAFGNALRLDKSLKTEIDAIRSKPATRPATSRPTQDFIPTRGPWKTLTPQESQTAVDRLKQRIATMLTRTPAKLTPYETEYFLFYSNLSQTEAVKWVAVLDRMYARLAELFDVPKGENRWHGKAAILVFLSRDDFTNFEKDVFKQERPAGGRCHGAANGDVIITFYRAPSDLEFARVLVHEATHGFIHRHRSPIHMPSWLNEGLAQVMEVELVPHAGLKQSADAEAKAELRRSDALKGFFTSRGIEFYQYPIARTLGEFMIRQNKTGYVDLINGIKDGTGWEEALQEKYGRSAQQLIAEYGTSMGVPGLKPD